MSSFHRASHSHYFSSQPLFSDDERRETIPVSLLGKTLSMTTGSGVFSKNKLDNGSQLLLTTLLQSSVLKNEANICDLGCGWGALGCFVAAHHQHAKVWMCDVNPRAAQLAKHNAAHNQLQNISVWCGDGLSAARAEYFDLIVCNPPIRAGNATIARMFDGAHRCLVHGGVLTVVIRTSQGAKSWQKRLSGSFGNCETPAIESGYRILQSVK